jgi:hypothetical protein
MWDIKTKLTLIELGQKLEPVKATAAVRPEDFGKLVRRV